MQEKETRNFTTISQLLDMPVSDITGAEIGRVAYALSAKSEGRIAYVTIRLHADDPAPGARVVVPWSAISRNGKWQVAARAQTLRDLSSPPDSGC